MLNDEQPTEEPYDEDADILCKLIFQLFREDPGDDRFRILDAMAFHCEYAFKHVDLRQGELSEQAKKELLASPAAPVLLAYIVSALHCYNGINGAFIDDPDATTATKRAALAEAFRLVGKPGESYPHITWRMAKGMWFQTFLRQETATQERDHPTADPAKRDKAARLEALKRLYRMFHGAEYDPLNDTHRSRWKNLRDSVAHISIKIDQSQGERK